MGPFYKSWSLKKIILTVLGIAALALIVFYVLGKLAGKRNLRSEESQPET
jgi:hypothetical protein